MHGYASMSSNLIILKLILDGQDCNDFASVASIFCPAIVSVTEYQEMSFAIKGKQPFLLVRTRLTQDACDASEFPVRFIQDRVP